MASASQTCSGKQCPVAAFAGEERPGSACPAAVEGAAVVVLTVAVPVVAVISGPGGRLDSQQGVSHSQRPGYALVVGAAKAKPGEVQKVERYKCLGGDGAVPAVAHLDLAAQAVRLRRWADPHVVARDSLLERKSGTLDVGPLLDPLVPTVSELEHVLTLAWVKPGRTGYQGRDLDGEAERARTGVLLPAVLRA
jgi:hypothetical protein